MKQYTVKPRYNVSLGTRIFQRYIEINVILREFYMGVYLEGPENTNVITRENIISRFHCTLYENKCCKYCTSYMSELVRCSRADLYVSNSFLKIPQLQLCVSGVQGRQEASGSPGVAGSPAF